MDFAVLGPLRVTGDFGLIEIPGAKERTLLAHLISCVGRTVPTDALIDSLWGDSPPRSAVKSLQTYVLRVRNALEPQRSRAPSVLVTEGAGYRLTVDPLTVDAHRFLRLVDLGHQALQAGRPGEASRTLAQAEQLWRGRAYAGFEETSFGGQEASRLAEIRLTAQQDRLAAELDLGASSSVIPELERLVAAEPYREQLWILLVRALYRSGRQADALAGYERVRTLLDNDLGIDPGPELQHLLNQVLAQDPALMRTVADDVRSRPSEHRLVGRDRELSWLRQRVSRARQGEAVTVAITGRAGSGVTRLVQEIVAEAAALPAASSAGGTPLVVAAESAPWPDPDQGQLVVTMIRDGQRPPDGADVLSLGPLDLDAVREIVAGYVEPDQVDDTATAVLATTGGWPGGVHRATDDRVREAATVRVLAARGAAQTAADSLAVARADLADGLLSLRTASPTGDSVEHSPWKGLAAYEQADAPSFFGRERLVAELLARVASSRVVGLVGASGSGKSSLLKAGLLASLAGGVLPDSGAWRLIAFRPGSHPMRELADAAMRVGGSSATDVGDVLEQMIRGDVPAEAVSVLVVDQFEEVWTACASAEERSEFLDAILGFVDSRQSSTKVVLSVRADYLEALAEFPRLAALVADHLLLVGAPSAAEIRRAVELPAGASGLRFDVGLVDAIVADAGKEPGLLPVLSTALARLWAARDGDRLTFGAYIAGGALTGAIAGLAEDAYVSLSAAEQQTAKTMLLRLAGPGDGSTVTRRRVRSAELAALQSTDAAAVLDRLTAARLLTISDGYVEVAHEALFQEWPRLRIWLAEDAATRDLQRRLAVAAAEWDADGRERAQLWHGTRLDAGLDYATFHLQEITVTEKSFLDQSVDAVEAQRLDADRRAQTASRQNKRLRALLGVLILVAGLALVAGTAAIVSRQHAVQSEAQARGAQAAAEAAQTSAEAHRLAAVAISTEQLDLALLTAVAAVQVQTGPDTEAALISVLTREPAVLATFRSPSPLYHGAVSPDGKIFWVTDDFGLLHAVDTISGKRTGAYSLPGTGASLDVEPTTGAIALTTNDDNGGSVVVVNPDGSERWAFRAADIAERIAAPGTFPDPPALFLADGNVLFGQSSRLVVADGETGDVIHQIAYPQVGSGDLFLPLADGRVSMSISGTPYVMDPDGYTFAALPLPGVVVAASSSGMLAVLTGDAPGDRILQVYDGSTLQPVGQPFSSTAFRGGIAFSPDGSVLAVGNGELLDLRNGRTGALQDQLTGHSAGMTAVQFTADGMIWSTGADGTAIGWDLSEGHGVLATSRGDTQSGLGDNAVANDVAVGLYRPDETGSVLLVDPRSGQTLGDPLPMPDCGFCEPKAVAITPDGTRALAGTWEFSGPPADLSSTVLDQGTLAVWDVQTRKLSSTISLPWKITGIDVAPDGRNAVVNGDVRAAVVDLDSGTVTQSSELHAVPGFWGYGNQASISPDGATAAVGVGGGLQLIEVPSAKVLRTGQLPDGDDVSTMGWSADGSSLMVGGFSGRVYILAAADLALVSQSLVTGGAVSDVLASPNGRWAASVGVTGELTIWDATTWQPLGQPIADGGPSSTVFGSGWLGFDPDGITLRELRTDGTAMAFVLDAGSWLSAACRIANRDLTAEEWAVLRPGVEQTPTCTGPR